MHVQTDRTARAPMRWAKTLVLAAVVTLTACASGPGGNAPDAAQATAGQPRPPEVVNRTPFAHLTLTGVDQFGEYSSLALKLSYRIDAQGQWHPAAAQEPMLSARHDVADDYRCMPYGGGYNQRTVWYPDTGLFVRGAQLVGLTGAQGTARPLQPLREGDHRALVATGAGARAVEYGYVPCVGAERVPTGHRTTGYVKPGDRLQLRPQGPRERAVTLTVPQGLRPYVALEFAGRAARALVPANLVVLSIDWPRRRAVAQYQVTVALQPQVARATWFTTLPTAPATRDVDKAALDANAAIERYLAACPSGGKPMDPCANPNGEPPPLPRP